MNKEQQIVEFQKDIIHNLFNGGTYKLAEALYNAGYRKTFTSDLASDTQKAYKEGYDKGFLDGREISKSDIERLKTQLQQANAGIVNCIGCHLVELNAVKDFADKLKGKLQDFDDGGEKGAYITEKDIDELLKEYE